MDQNGCQHGPPLQTASAVPNPNELVLRRSTSYPVPLWLFVGHVDYVDG